jgi:APA family basic amino acid/polyamine antiporter
MGEQITKKYGVMAATSVVAGAVIGIGIFFKTGELLTVTNGNTVIGLLAWIVAGVFTIISGLNWAEMASNYTESGGDVTYCEKMVGKPLAFITGWGTVIVGYPAVAAILGWVGVSYLVSLLGLDASWQLPLTLIIVFFIYIMNLLAPKFSGKFNFLITVIKLIPLALMIIFGLISHGEGAGMFAPDNMVVNGNAISVFFAALFPVAFVLAGWKEVSVVSGEIRKPEKNLPKAIILGIGLIVVVYICLYIGFVNVLPGSQLAQGDTVPFGVAEIFFGSFGSKFVMIGIILSAFGALNSMALVNVRYAYGLAIKRLFPFSEKFSKVSQKSETPVLSGILGLILTLVHVICINFGYDFSSTFTTTVYIILAILLVQLIRMRKAGKMSAGDMYKTKLFPLFPILSIAFSVLLVVGSFLVDQTTSRNMLLAIIFYASGLPFYLFEQHRQKKMQRIEGKE